MLAGCSWDPDMSPYLLPQPPDMVPWTAKNFTLRYSEWWNTDEELRAKIAELCGPDIDFARITTSRRDGSALHPHNLSVACGTPSPPKPAFRGQTVDEGTLISLKPPAPVPAQ